MPIKKDNKITLILILIVIGIPLLLGIAYRFRSELRLEQHFSQVSHSLFSKKDLFVKIDIFAGVNKKDLRIIFNVPCKNIKTKQLILENMTVIKHELLMSLEEEQNREAVEERDFGRIKSNCMSILTRYASVDVNKVYVEFFGHN